MPLTDLQSVVTYRDIIEKQLQELYESRESERADTPVTESDCATLVEVLKSFRKQEDATDNNTSAHFSAIETVFREDFDGLVAATDIFGPAFFRVWVLLDVITVLSDNELCEPGLGFWLIEELLDSQTIDGCRRVFDYLESRRERITAKHFKHKSLVILRCCNELLRRLSRAEDTVFCGRVFIFLFQSFPLGDKSSVNLRGEFHVENITIFDPSPQKSDDAIKPMEIDSKGGIQVASGGQTPASMVIDGDQGQKTGRSTPSASKSVKSEPKTEEPPDLDALYPKFWSLQSFFSSPTRLFDMTSMNQFKDGISATLACFKAVSDTSAITGLASEVQRGVKRKRSDVEPTNSATTFNPKYLTNRDLFDLEIHDIAFRRHILVQALIMIDFLLSLAPAAKSKFDGLTNKSVLYPYTLSEEDTKWAHTIRSSIASYLQQQGNGNEGKFYYRMVDTVLSRDKNWVRWKAENCPSISLDPVNPEQYAAAQKTLFSLCRKQPLPLPPGAADFNFLSGPTSEKSALDALKHPSKRGPAASSMQDYWKAIQNDDLDLEFATTDEEKKEVEERKAGRVWRALRAANGRRFVLSEKIQNGTNLKALVEEDQQPPLRPSSQPQVSQLSHASGLSDENNHEDLAGVNVNGDGEIVGNELGGEEDDHHDGTEGVVNGENNEENSDTDGEADEDVDVDEDEDSAMKDQPPASAEEEGEEDDEDEDEDEGEAVDVQSTSIPSSVPVAGRLVNEE